MYTFPQTSSRIAYLFFVLVVMWLVAHIPGLMYGARNTPLHVTYVGDEQVSVNSALRVLNEKNILAFRNREMQYYGPLFVVFDTPGIIVDFSIKYATGVIKSAEDYKRYILWDWGGIIKNIRVTAVLSMFIGLMVIYRLAGTVSVNPSRARHVSLLVAVLLGINYYYFEYSHFAIHWAYVLPLLLLQIFSLVRIQETRGAIKKYWVLHALSCIASFGVSYISMIFLSMWIPELIRMLRQRDIAQFRRFAWCMGGIILGWALVVWWHPYAFIRYLSFLGIGEPLHNQGDAQNPFALTQLSLGYYAVLLILNNIGLFLATLLLFGKLGLKQVMKLPIVWIILLPGIVNFFVFGLSEHHEGRYMLPTILTTIIFFGYLFSRYLIDHSIQSRIVNITLATLIGWYVLFNFVHVVLWIDIFSRGPLEQQAIKTALELQKSGSPVLIINSYLFGHPHTKESYRAFAEHRKFGDIPLYREIYANPLPSDRVPLDARYMYLADYEKDPTVLKNYPHAIMLFEPRDGEWNQFSYFDEDIVRNWYYRDLSNRYIVLK